MEKLSGILLALATSCLGAWVLLVSFDGTDGLRVAAGTLAIGFAVAAAFFYKRDGKGPVIAT